MPCPCGRLHYLREGRLSPHFVILVFSQQSLEVPFKYAIGRGVLQYAPTGGCTRLEVNKTKVFFSKGLRTNPLLDTQAGDDELPGGGAVLLCLLLNRSDVFLGAGFDLSNPLLALLLGGGNRFIGLLLSRGTSRGKAFLTSPASLFEAITSRNLSIGNPLAGGRLYLLDFLDDCRIGADFNRNSFTHEG